MDKEQIRLMEETKNNNYAYQYEIRLSVDGTDIDLDAIRALFAMAFKGEMQEVSGTASSVTIDYCTNEPWKVLEYCATFGKMHHITITNRNYEESTATEGISG